MHAAAETSRSKANGLSKLIYRKKERNTGGKNRGAGSEGRNTINVADEERERGREKGRKSGVPRTETEEGRRSEKSAHGHEEPQDQRENR